VSEKPFDVQSYVGNAEIISNENGEQQWSLDFGTEKQIPDLLLALSDSGAKDITLDLTTLEAVFLATGEENFEGTNEAAESNAEENASGMHNNVDTSTSASDDVELGHGKDELQARVWEQRATVSPISYMQKCRLVEHFVRTNAFKMKGSIALNISMPMLYMVIGLVVVSLIPIQTEGEAISNPPIKVSTPWTPSEFFGVQSLPNNSISPLQPIQQPSDLASYFDGSLPIIGGHFAENLTLSYAPNVDSFALQFGISVVANYSTWLGNSSTLNDGISTSVQQLPYITDNPFRMDLLLLPMMLSFGFAGLSFSVLDVLLLKGNNIIELFRVGGITEWMTYVGVTGYKLKTTFIPFFFVTLILGLSLKSVLFGNGGRWLGTILIMFTYAYSSTPIGLVLAKRFIKGDYKEVANWFPGVYFTFVALPYVAWSSALQAVPSAQEVILTIGDVLCIVPFFAFQRGLGGVILVSTEFNDDNLSWGDVWAFYTRIWYTIFVMMVVGSMWWLFLYRLTSRREPKTALTDDEVTEFGTPRRIIQNPDVIEERERSLKDNEGINARDIVKAFAIKKKTKADEGLGCGRKKKRVIKSALKGVSIGVRQNEIFALLGPNGSGKSTLMNCLASQLTPEYGEISLGGAICSENDLGTDHLYHNGNVSFCPQFDALFPKKTVNEHVKFYATTRGLDWDADATQEHINAIIELLGLEQHKTKEATELSGGYKRRLCLAVAMIGYPKVAMLDEPTTGLDPSARHLVWEVLKPSVRTGYNVAAILLSSHYMDECQQLGSRIGIIIDGELITTGELSRLQELYCTGLFVEISLHPDVADSITTESLAIDAFAKIGMDASVYESLPLHFKLKVSFQQDMVANNHSVAQLAEAFRMLETNKSELRIQFYSVSLMSLEQIFIDLSRKQFEKDEE
jgi:ABC-type multidrug transport system ATPase subunit